MGRVGTRGAHAQVGSRLSWSFSARASYGPRPPRHEAARPGHVSGAGAGALRSVLRTAGHAARFAARHRPGRRRHTG
ncbi:hypothetical protein [Streptomyces sp. LaPpAH-108]|uniref:hypothetical protein n=1 Tax=Streptomyces sp. LaPpAH-108 TaxID=1155714 RepID=UPI001319E7E6|nr:hypothetical protein [Streptomyces sp. LaPpAH-108]